MKIKSIGGDIFKGVIEIPPQRGGRIN